MPVQIQGDVAVAYGVFCRICHIRQEGQCGGSCCAGCGDGFCEIVIIAYGISRRYHGHCLLAADRTLIFAVNTVHMGTGVHLDRDGVALDNVAILGCLAVILEGALSGGIGLEGGGGRHFHISAFVDAVPDIAVRRHIRGDGQAQGLTPGGGEARGLGCNADGHRGHGDSFGDLLLALGQVQEGSVGLLESVVLRHDSVQLQQANTAVNHGDGIEAALPGAAGDAVLGFRQGQQAVGSCQVRQSIAGEGAAADGDRATLHKQPRIGALEGTAGHFQGGSDGIDGAKAGECSSGDGCRGIFERQCEILTALDGTAGLQEGAVFDSQPAAVFTQQSAAFQNQGTPGHSNRAIVAIFFIGGGIVTGDASSANRIPDSQLAAGYLESVPSGSGECTQMGNGMAVQVQNAHAGTPGVQGVIRITCVDDLDIL